MSRESIIGSASVLLTSVLGAQELRPLFDRPVVDVDAPVRSTLAPRGPEMRAEFASRHPDEPRAIDAGLAWLATQQVSDGSFHDDAADDIEVTAAAVLAFLAAGCEPAEGQYGDLVGRGLSWLVSRQGADGWIGESSRPVVRDSFVRAHSMATYVLVDVALYGGYPRLRDCASAALSVLATSEGADPWLDVALAYGVRAGLPVDGPRTSDLPEGQGSRAVAGAIFATYMRAVARETRPPVPDRVVEATWQLVEADAEDPSLVFLALMGLRQIGGATWMRCERPLGHWARARRPDGSWAAAGGSTGSPYVTAMRVLALEHAFICIRYFRR
jgi:hypothetical protein